MDGILVNFLISYLAGKVDSINNLFSNKSAISHLEDNFRNSLWNWLKVNENKRRRYEINSLKDLHPYLLSSEHSEDPEIQALVNLLKEEIYKDQISKALLDDYQHTQIQHLNTQILNEVMDTKQMLSKTADSTKSINQNGDFPIAIGDNNGTINIYSDKETQTDEEITSTFREYSSLRNNPPTLYPVIKREIEQHEILEWIKNPSEKDHINRVGFITGSPGVGKTAFTNMIFNELSEINAYLVWGLKVDQIEFKDVDNLAEKMRFKKSLLSIIDRIRKKYERIVIIIDQIDALSLSLSSDRTPLTTIANFIYDLSLRPGVRVLVSCREYDINNDPILKDLFNFRNRWRLNNFSKDKVISILNANNSESNLSEELINFLGNPLNLSLYLMAGESDITLNPLNVNSLYDIIWRNKILNHSYKTDEKLNLIEFIGRISEAMYNAQRINVPVVKYQTAYFKEIDYLSSVGLIRQENNRLQFFHQTLYDYVYARRFVENEKSLIEELKNQHQGLFIRSQIHSVLLYLRSHVEDNYFATVKAILNPTDGIRFHIKVLTLTLMATQSSPSHSEKWLAKNIIFPNKELGRVFFNAISTKEWFDFVLSEIGPWLDVDADYRGNIINSSLRLLDFQLYWAIDIVKSILSICCQEEQTYVLDQLQRKHFKADPEILHDFYKFLKSLDPNRYYPKILDNLTKYDSNLVFSEITGYVKHYFSDPKNKKSFEFRFDYEWSDLLRRIEGMDADAFLDLAIILIKTISESTQFEHQVYSIKDNYIYHTIKSPHSEDMRYDTSSYLYSYLVDTLIDKHKHGIDIGNTLNTLINSDHSPLVCAGLTVLRECCSPRFEDLIFSILSGDKFLISAPCWVEYYAKELLNASFFMFDIDRQTQIVDNIMTFKSGVDNFLSHIDSAQRIEHGIPASYQGYEVGTILHSIPDNLLKNVSSEAWKKRLESERKFKNISNEEPSKIESFIGWASIPQENADKMDVDAWRSSMKKYNSDIHNDFKTPTLTGQSHVFKNVVASNPDKFIPLLMEIFDEEDISMKYLLAGLEGLIAADRIDDAAVIVDHLFHQWIGDDINITRRDFSLHSYLFAISNLIERTDINPVFFETVRRIVLEADDSHDMENYSGFDMMTHAINTTRGNAVYNLVDCARLPRYSGDIFDVLEKIAPTANVSTRAAALINLALLNNIDKDRNVTLFKSLLHDFNPLLMSLPIHNLNPLVYFVRYAFDQLKDYFEKVVITPSSHQTQMPILWLAHQCGNESAIDYLFIIKSANPESMPWLVSFFSQQNYYDKESIVFASELVKDLDPTSELANAMDTYLEYLPIAKSSSAVMSDIKNLLLQYSSSGLVSFITRGYLNILKQLSVVNPELTMQCLSIYLSNHLKDVNYNQNEVVEILINAYNRIRKYNLPGQETILEKAMDYLDSLLLQTSVPSYLNSYINQIDNG